MNRVDAEKSLDREREPVASGADRVDLGVLTQLLANKSNDASEYMVDTEGVQWAMLTDFETGHTIRLVSSDSGLGSKTGINPGSIIIEDFANEKASPNHLFVSTMYELEPFGWPGRIREKTLFVYTGKALEELPPSVRDLSHHASQVRYLDDTEINFLYW